MIDTDKTKAELLSEVRALRRELEESRQARIDLEAARSEIQGIREAVRNALDQSPLPVLSIDRQGIIATWNRACESCFQYGREVIGSRHDLLWPDAETARQVDDLIAGQFDRPVFDETEMTFRRRDGATVPTSTRLFSFADPGLQMERCVLACIDATRRNQTLSDLEASEERLRLLTETTGEALYQLRYATMAYDYMSSGIAGLTGYTPEELGRISFKSLVKRIISPDGSTLARDYIIKERQSGRTGEYRADYLIATRSGEERWLADHSFPWYDDHGRLIGSVGILTDITQRKKMENALRESEEKYRLLVENMPLGIVVVQDGLIQYVNASLLSVAGRPRESIQGKHFLDFTHPDDRGEAMRRYLARLAGQSPGQTGPVRMIGPTGEAVWAQVRGMPIYWEGRPAVLNFVQDVTAQKRAERELSLFFDVSPDLMCIIDGRGVFRRVNPAFERTLGWSADELVDRYHKELLHPDDLEATRQVKRRIMNGEHLPRIENRYRRKDGAYRWLAWTAAHLFEENLTFAVARDVTEDKRLAQKLAESEEKYRAVINEAADGILLTSPQGCILEVNSKAAELLGYSREECLKLNVGDIYPDKEIESRIDLLKELLETGAAFLKDTFLLHKDGRKVPVEVSGSLITFGGQKVALGIVRDITERKKTEAWIQDALQEKEVLLREIHHRVKNNLQVVSSLLNLQAYGLDDPRLSEAIQESQNRIMAMALIHETLYQSSSLACIHLGPYLRELIASLTQAYSTERRGLDVRVHVEDVVLDMDHAVPIGLVINELVSNALKHAFPRGGPGEVHASARLVREGAVEIEVRDDGSGLPEGVETRKSGSLGLPLVMDLVRQQLKGEILIHRDPGTRFVIRFEPVRRSCRD